MLALQNRKRRMRLLKELAERSNGRHDMDVPLSEVAATLDIRGFAGGRKFVDSSNPLYEGGSDLAYDFNTLREEGLIQQAYIGGRYDNYGELTDAVPGVKVTSKGFEALEEEQKSWLRKAIDKQPVTFLQIVVTLIFSLVTFFLGLAIGTRG